MQGEQIYYNNVIYNMYLCNVGSHTGHEMTLEMSDGILMECCGAYLLPPAYRLFSCNDVNFVFSLANTPPSTSSALQDLSSAWFKHAAKSGNQAGLGKGCISITNFEKKKMIKGTEFIIAAGGIVISGFQVSLNIEHLHACY